MRINLHNQTQEDIIEVESLLKRIFKPIREKNNLQVIFVTQNEIQELNKKFRNIDRPTDVLSFINDDEDDKSLGDVFISLEQARIQAKEFEHSLEREIGFLAVHGYLHLKGYDHYTKAEEEIMKQEQEKILKKAKLERS
ncbi:rRNA maturation RNase YbeY [Peloplasma aerotolerans]|uniref:Endoribonuclease YbeY n=1 Tax=Peloplasma aerotolerans TaxID=3044389 RepID=A0AAW6U9I4_9MOLU|nr:rRNA maturation RNase YbeY [Mariniplasma sp. M4Ah]MDI6452614.1 rRNA maturation RNase YbeY [Mariniplasma sp. M4Ah]